MFRTSEEAVEKSMGEGVLRRVLIHRGRLMAVEFHFDRGAVVPAHSHPHEQVGYIVKGSFEFNIGGETRVLRPGDTYCAPPGVEHGATALEDSVALDVFTPVREDYL